MLSVTFYCYSESCYAECDGVIVKAMTLYFTENWTILSRPNVFRPKGFRSGDVEPTLALTQHVNLFDVPVDDSGGSFLDVLAGYDLRRAAVR
jgi:hypothetical protein